MSQKPTPKSPRSKSPSCQEDESPVHARPSSRRVIEEVQRQVQEGLESSERMIQAASSLISGLRSPSRPVSVQEGIRSQSASSQRRSGSRSPTCYADESLQLPSPPRSPMPHTSHGVTPGSSQRGTRVPTPEYSKSRAGSMHPVRSKAEESGMGPNMPEYEDSMDQRPFYRDMATSYSHKQFNLWEPPDGPDEEPDPGYMSFNQSRGMVSESTSMRGQSSAGYNTFNESGGMVSESTSMRGQTSFPNSREVFGLNSTAANSSCAVAPSVVTFGSQRVESTASGMNYGMRGVESTISGRNYETQREESTISGMNYGMSRGETAAASMVACGPSRGESSACSRMSYGPSRGELTSASTIATPVSNAASKYSYKPEESSTKVYCKGACARYADEGERPGSGGRVDPSKSSMTYKTAISGSKMSQPSWTQQFSKQGGLDQHSHHGMATGRPQIGYDKYTRPPQAASPGPGAHQHHHHDGGTDSFLKRDDRATSALAHLSQLKKTPSYFMCSTSQGIDFLNSCSGGKAKFPEPPCLHQEELNELIKCERQDVESAWYLASEENRPYKKPCPKQQKAQMGVKALVSAHSNQACGGEKYGPLDHPDPDDISPEVAAKMMFSQEQGIKMEECPRDTIAHLFPDEPKTRFPEKVPRSTISIVDPNQKDREELMEKSASVPSEGVSDSAYTRTMKEKGDDLVATKSYDVDFAIGQSKREYVLVAQKPQRFNRVQFRGGNLPSWFPGYFSAFPGEDGNLKSLPSPSGVFHKAWVHTNPRNIPTSDVFVLE